MTAIVIIDTAPAQDRCQNVPNRDRDIRATQSARRGAAARVARNAKYADSYAEPGSDAAGIAHILYTAKLTD